jgi:DNA polymerase
MAENYGAQVPEEEAATIVRAWRANRPATVKLWKESEKAAMEAIRNPGRIVTCGKIAFRVVGGFLAMRLPSGRCLRYPMPYIGTKKLPWLDDNGNAQTVPAIWFWGIDERNQWSRQSTYGGCLVENATQAVARDCLSDAMLRVAKNGKYDIVLHVHDEIVAETTTGTLEEFQKIVLEQPEWAPDLPLAGEGWEGKRYRK